MKTNPLTLHLVLERSHSNLVLFHVDIAAITQTKQRRLRGGHAAVTHNFSVCGAAAWFQLMLHLFFGPEACGKKGPWVLPRTCRQVTAAATHNRDTLTP